MDRDILRHADPDRLVSRQPATVERHKLGLVGMNWPNDFINKIICGDCLGVMKHIPDGAGLSIVTDPVWPNAVNIFNIGNPKQLLVDCLAGASRFTVRVVVHLGLDSDPRFLSAVPEQYEFVRSFALRLARPHYKGRILYDRDVGYLFGPPPSSIPGRRVLVNGRFTDDVCDSNTSSKPDYHPCPRKLSHVSHLIWQCTDPNDTVLDPFCGSGTTCVAAKQLGRKYIGIEIKPDYCKVAEDRLRQGELFGGGAA